jgi:hypothetical protein
MATSISQPTPGGLIGPGVQMQIALGGTSTAGDFWQVTVDVGGTFKLSQHMLLQFMAAGLHTPQGVLGWDYNFQSWEPMSLDGIATGTAVNVHVDWYSALFVLKGTSSTAFTWDNNAYVTGQLWGQQHLAGVSGSLAALLAAVTKQLPSLP